MDENLKNEDKKVMLVQTFGEGQIKGVTDIDRKGNVKVTRNSVSGDNLMKLFDVNTHDSAVEAFFRKLVEQAQNPSHTDLSKAVAKLFIIVQSTLDKLLKVGLDTELLEPYRIDTAAELQKLEQQRQGPQKPEQQTTQTQQDGDNTSSQSFQPLDIDKIDREDMERKGIRPESIEPHLKAMSYGHKSSALVDMSPELEQGGIRVPTKGRVSLEEQPDGSVRVIPHYWQERPNLDAPLHGVLLPDDVKANLEATRHAGRAIDL
jgi:hypothetical protein